MDGAVCGFLLLLQIFPTGEGEAYLSFLIDFNAAQSG